MPVRTPWRVRAARGGRLIPGGRAPQLEEEFVQANPAWVQELEIMVASKVKAEIQALSSFGFQYLSQARRAAQYPREGGWGCTQQLVKQRRITMSCMFAW